METRFIEWLKIGSLHFYRVSGLVQLATAAEFENRDSSIGQVDTFLLACAVGRFSNRLSSVLCALW